MKNNFVVVTGRSIKEFREKKGLDQANFAKSVGKSRQTINTWESKLAVKMDADDAEQVAKVLGVNVKDLTFAGSLDIKTGDDSEVPEDKYKDLIEKNTLYLLVPRSILEEKYRLMPVAQIEKEAGMIATQNKTIEHLLDVQKALLKKIDELESQAKPVKVK